MSLVPGLATTIEHIHIGTIFINPTDPHIIGNVDFNWGANNTHAIDPSLYLSSHLGMCWPHGGPTGGPDESPAAWKAVHPDWVTYKNDRVTYAQVDATAGLDFSAQAVQNLQFAGGSGNLGDFLDYRAGGSNAIGFDNVLLTNWTGMAGVFRSGTWTQLYSGGSVDTAYATAVITWLHTMYARIKAYDGTAGVFCNVNVLEANMTQLIPYADGFLWEAGFSNTGGHWGGGERITDSQWATAMTVLQQIQAAGKAVILGGYTSATTNEAVSQADIQWNLANYLLLKGQQTFTYVQASPYAVPSEARSYYDRPEYHIQIGHAISERYQAQNVWMRDYSGGKVLVNPSSTQSATVTLPSGVYRDLYGTVITTNTPIHMAPASGYILLFTPWEQNPYGGVYRMYSTPLTPIHTADIDDIVTMGGKWIRLQIQWFRVELTQGGGYDAQELAVMDDAIHQCNLRGVAVQFVIQDPPYWRMSSTTCGICRPDIDISLACVNGQWHVYDPLATRDYVDFLTKRYNGVSTNNSLGIPLYVHAWELGNEEFDNFYDATQPVTSAGQVCRQARWFIPVLQACAPVIRANSPNALIGLCAFWWPNTQHQIDFMQALYTNNCKGLFEYANIHMLPNMHMAPPTQDVSPDNLSLSGQLTTIAQVMRTNGDTHARIWVTALGWHVTDDVSESTRQQYFTTALDSMRLSGSCQRMNVLQFKEHAIDPRDAQEAVNTPGPPNYTPTFLTLRAYVAQYPTWGEGGIMPAPITQPMNVTFYGYAENEPPNSTTITYPHDSYPQTVHNQAGGIGTYDDPRTAALSPSTPFALGTRFYLPFLQKYAIYEDACSTCSANQLSIWMNSSADYPSETRACETYWAQSTTPVEVYPLDTRLVYLGPLFNTQTGTCLSALPPNTSCLTTAPTTLTFTLTDYGNHTPKSLLLTNCGENAGSWTATPSASWFSLSTTSGYLAAGASVPLNVTMFGSTGGSGAQSASIDVTLTDDMRVTTITLPITYTAAPDPVGAALMMPTDNPYGNVIVLRNPIQNTMDTSIVNDMKLIGAKWARVQSLWDNIEMSQGNYDSTALAHIDDAIYRLNQGGIYVQFVIQSPPAWRLSKTSCGSCSAGSGMCIGGRWYQHDPTQTANFADFLSKRYNGVSTNNSLGKTLYVTAWEIGNEEFDNMFDPSQPTTSAAQDCRKAKWFIPVLQKCAPVIRQNSPNALIGMCSLWWEDSQHHKDFMQALYDNNCASLFDYANIHWYPGSTPPDQNKSSVRLSLQGQLQEIANVMIANHDMDPFDPDDPKKIWITEFGWAVPSDVSESTRKNYALQAYDIMRSSGYVGVTNLYVMKENAVDPHVAELSITNPGPPNYTSTFAAIQGYVRRYPQWLDNDDNTSNPSLMIPARVRLLASTGPTLTRRDVSLRMRLRTATQPAQATRDTKTRVRLRQVTTGSGGAITHDLYVAGHGFLDVYRREQGYARVKHFTNNTWGVEGIAFAPPTHQLTVGYGSDGYQGCGDNKGHMYAWDVMTDTKTWDVTFSHGIDSHEVTRDGRYLYIPNGETNHVSSWYKHNANDGSQIKTVGPQGDGPHNTSVNIPNTHVYFCPRHSAYMFLIDLATDTLIRQIGPVRGLSSKEVSGRNIGCRPFVFDSAEHYLYLMATGYIGFQVFDITTGSLVWNVDVNSSTFPNNQSTVTCPAHGVAMTPDETKLYTVDTANNYVHVWDIAGVPNGVKPTPLKDIHLGVKFLGRGENPCCYNCARDSWLTMSVDGKYLFVGDSAEIVDCTTDTVAFTNITSMLESRKPIEIVFQNGIPIATSTRHSNGMKAFLAPTPTADGYLMDTYTRMRLVSQGGGGPIQRSRDMTTHLNIRAPNQPAQRQRDGKTRYRMRELHSTTTGGGTVNKRLMYVYMENRSWQQIFGSGKADWPYTNQLAQQYSYALDNTCYGTGHPSAPNHLSYFSGSKQGISGDPDPQGSINAPTILTRLQAASIPWAYYEEGLPSPGYLGGDVGKYVTHHNPAAYFLDTRTDTVMRNKCVGFNTLWSDLNKPTAQLATYVWVKPDNNHNGHDTTGTYPDNWLKGFIPQVLATNWYANGGMIIITWDEGKSTSGIGDANPGGGPTGYVVVSEATKNGGTFSTPFNWYGDLHGQLKFLGNGTLAELANSAHTSNGDASKYFGGTGGTGSQTIYSGPVDYYARFRLQPLGTGGGSIRKDMGLRARLTPAIPQLLHLYNIALRYHSRPMAPHIMEYADLPGHLMLAPGRPTRWRDTKTRVQIAPHGVQQYLGTNDYATTLLLQGGAPAVDVMSVLRLSTTTQQHTQDVPGTLRLVFAYDTFKRPNQQMWGTGTPDGYGYIFVSGGATADIVNNQGEIAYATGNVGNVLHHTAPVTDSDVYVETKLGDTDSTASIVMRCTQDGQTNYRVALDTRNLEIAKMINGNVTHITTLPVPIVAGQYYQLRGRVMGNLVSAKYWILGDPEPKQWMLSATDTSITTPGLVGLRARISPTTALVDFRNLVIFADPIALVVSDPSSIEMRLHFCDDQDTFIRPFVDFSWGSSAESGTTWMRLGGHAILNTTGYQGTLQETTLEPDPTFMIYGSHQEVDGTYQCTITRTNDEDEVGLVARFYTPDNWYGARHRNGRLQLLKHSSDIEVLLAETLVDMIVNTPYTLVFSVLGTTLTAKMWQTGTAVPDVEQVMVTDTEHRLLGQYGLLGNATTMDAIYYDHYVVDLFSYTYLHDTLTRLVFESGESASDVVTRMILIETPLQDVSLTLKVNTQTQQEITSRLVINYALQQDMLLRMRLRATNETKDHIPARGKIRARTNEDIETRLFLQQSRQQQIVMRLNHVGGPLRDVPVLLGLGIQQQTRLAVRVLMIGQRTRDIRTRCRITPTLPHDIRGRLPFAILDENGVSTRMRIQSTARLALLRSRMILLSAPSSYAITTRHTVLAQKTRELSTRVRVVAHVPVTRPNDTQTRTKLGWIYDYYDRDNQAGWGTSPAGYDWSGGTSIFSIVDTTGHVTGANASNVRSMQTGASKQDVEARTTFSTSVVNTNSDIAPLVVRYQSDGTSYRLNLDSSDNLCEIRRAVGSTQTTLVSRALTLAPNTFYHCALRVYNTTNTVEIYARVWAEGTTEPTDWQLHASDIDTHVRSAGEVGTILRLATAGTVATFTEFTANDVPGPTAYPIRELVTLRLAFAGTRAADVPLRLVLQADRQRNLLQRTRLSILAQDLLATRIKTRSALQLRDVRVRMVLASQPTRTLPSRVKTQSPRVYPDVATILILHSPVLYPSIAERLRLSTEQKRSLTLRLRQRAVLRADVSCTLRLQSVLQRRDMPLEGRLAVFQQQDSVLRIALAIGGGNEIATRVGVQAIPQQDIIARFKLLDYEQANLLLRGRIAARVGQDTFLLFKIAAQNETKTNVRMRLSLKPPVLKITQVRSRVRLQDMRLPSLEGRIRLKSPVHAREIMHRVSLISQPRIRDMRMRLRLRGIHTTDSALRLSLLSRLIQDVRMRDVLHADSVRLLLTRLRMRTGATEDIATTLILEGFASLTLSTRLILAEGVEADYSSRLTLASTQRQDSATRLVIEDTALRDTAARLPLIDSALLDLPTSLALLDQARLALLLRLALQGIAIADTHTRVVLEFPLDYATRLLLAKMPDILARLLLRAASTPDMQTRLGLQVTQEPDIPTRLHLTIHFIEWMTRVGVAIQLQQEIGTRVGISIQLTQDLATRITNTALIHNDYRTRVVVRALPENIVYHETHGRSGYAPDQANPLPQEV